MTFRAQIKNKYYGAATIKYHAKQFIYLAQLGSTETLLNQYLYKEFKTSLIAACIKVINNGKYSFNKSGEVIITFPEKTINNLASIITFGTGGKIMGSNILRLAFGQI